MLKTNRKTEYPVEPLILSRWSARALSQEPMSDTQLMTIFDAARWAQNSFNNQPWRFIYSRNGSATWQTFLDLLVSANKEWAQNARVLILVISKKTFDYDGRPSITHTFDTGAAAQNMALQAAAMDIVCHGIEGFDYAKAKTVLKIPEEYHVEAMFALGKLGNKQDLPEKYREREQPTDRKPLKDVVFEGEFK
jgi:nitroreductase